MKAEQIAKAGTEGSHQAAFFCALREHFDRYPALAFAFAVPNGEERNVAVAAKLRAQGVKRGVPDIFIPIPSKGYHGLWIEMKRPKGNGKAAGTLSQDQKNWQAFLISQNYAHVVVEGYLPAIASVLNYLN